MRKAICAAAILMAWMLAAPAAADFIGQSDAEVQAVADPILDTVLKGFNEGNYGLYSKFFDATLKDTITEKKFQQVRSQILKSLGKYQSRTYLGFLKKGRTTLVLWRGTFDHSPDDVLIKLVVSRRGDHNEVVGLWFQ